MSRPTDIRLTNVRYETERYDYRSPMKFGGRVVRDVVLFNVSTEVESRDGRRGTGFGSMTMGNIWAWAGGVTDPQVTLDVMIEFAESLVQCVNGFKEFGHPLELVYDFSKEYAALAERLEKKHALQESMPKLAQLVAASPWEASLFDAFGDRFDAEGEGKANGAGDDVSGGIVVRIQNNHHPTNRKEQILMRQPWGATRWGSDSRATPFA